MLDGVVSHLIALSMIAAAACSSGASRGAAPNLTPRPAPTAKVELVALLAGQSITTTGAPSHLMLDGRNSDTSPHPLQIVRLEYLPDGEPLTVRRIGVGNRVVAGSPPIDLVPGSTELVVWFSGEQLPLDAASYRFRIQAIADGTPITIDAEVHRARREPLNRR